MIGPEWLYHPLGLCQGTSRQIIQCQSYNFWSGISGSILATIVGNIMSWPMLALVYLRHHNCHHKGCKKLGHRHPMFGWPACKDHWDERPEHVGVRDPGDVIGTTTQGGNW